MSAKKDSIFKVIILLLQLLNFSCHKDHQSVNSKQQLNPDREIRLPYHDISHKERIKQLVPATLPDSDYKQIEKVILDNLPERMFIDAVKIDKHSMEVTYGSIEKNRQKHMDVYKFSYDGTNWIIKDFTSVSTVK